MREAIWALLPQEKTPEFLADQAAYERFEKVMSALGQRFYVTPTIIALNVAVFIVMLAAGADLIRPNPAILIRFGSNYGPLTWTGEEWRLLTSAFLHFGILHLALNMFALYQGGALIERLFGSTRFALVYLLSALSGSVVSGWWDPLRNSAGASGAIFGVYGALLAFMAVRRADIPPSALKSISISTVLFCAVFAGVRRGASADRQCLPRRRVVRRRHLGCDPGASVHHRGACRSKARKAGRWLCWSSACHWRGWRSRWSPTMAAMPPASDSSASLPTFDRIEADLVRKQADILTIPPDVRVNRLEIAKRLRDEVLIPWREASRPILQSPTIPEEDAHSARLQMAWRNYVRAREEAVALWVLALETGDLSDQERAISADARMSQTLNVINVLMRE